MAKNPNDRDDDDKPLPKPDPGFRVETGPENYDEYDDYDYGFDHDLGEAEVY